MLLEHRSLGALAIVWLITAAGCALEEADVDFRDGAVLEDPNTIPGGGPCKRCVRGFQQSGNTLQLCVDTSVRYVPGPRDTGPSLLSLLTSKTASPKWKLVNGDLFDKNLCAGSGCYAKLGKSYGRYVIAELPVSQGWKAPDELNLVLTGYDNRPHGNDLGEMPRISLTKADPTNWLCAAGVQPPVPAPPPLQPVLSPFLAQLAFPWPRGGVRSCSGVLVSPRHILTAAHCFDYDGLDAEIDFMKRIEVRFGTAPWLAAGSVIDVLVHEDYYPRKLDADLAIVELASDVDPAIKPAPLLELDGEHTTGDFWAHGYGVRPGSETEGYDWGSPRSVKTLWSPLPLTGAEHLTQHMHFEHLEASPALCQGDSGGPVMTDIAGTRTLVAILSARVGLHANRSSPEVEPMVAGLAFNHGHACGELESTYGYVATPFDADTLDWIYGHIDAHIGVWPPLE